MKYPTNPFLRVSIAAAALAAAAHATDLTWNTALPGDWNTSNTNWTGSTWNNGTPDNAIFNNANGTVTLTEAITAGSLSFVNGGVPSGFHELKLTGSNLSLGSVSVSGGYNDAPYNGGVDSVSDAYNQRLRFDTMTLNVSGDATVRRGMFYLISSTVNFGGAIKSTDAWGVFRSDSSTVTITGGIDLSTIASAVELYGGTVATPFIKVGNAGWDGGTGLFMGGGVTVVATQNSSDFLQVYNGGDTGSRGAATLTGGVTTLNTSTYAVTVATQLNGVGSLTKTGSGTLTLTQSNSYTGGTTVNQGMLVLKAGAWTLNNVGGGGVTVGSGATLRADNSVANQINGLTLNGGTVEAINSSGNGDWGNFFLTGNVTATGTSNLSADIALRASNVDFNVASGGTLNAGGVLHNGAYFGIYSGSAATVSKSGAGAMVLTGTNTYTGATTVSGGTLEISGSIGSSDVTVNGGILASGSTGTVGRNVTVNSGATLAAGGVGAVGSATAANDLNFSSGSIFDWDLTTGSGNGTYDTVTVTGALNITSGAKFNVVSSTAFTSTFWNAPHTWSDIFGSKTFDNFTVANFLYSGSTTAPAAEGYFTVSGSSLSWTAVPEPTSALAGLLMTAGLLRRRRHQPNKPILPRHGPVSMDRTRGSRRPA